ncbi:MAG: SDR family oxidoreductase [Streptosporangiales bacterium]|nr:SDR family oxidoreductase [Streptosporangiales bacterium]
MGDTHHLNPGRPHDRWNPARFDPVRRRTDDLQRPGPLEEGGPVSGLAGRRAAVTGAGSGIGREIARRPHAAGAAVTLIDIDADAVRTVAAELGVGAEPAVADVTDEAALEAAVRTAAPLHIGVNAAGAGTFGEITELAADEWRRILDLCLTGVFLSVKHQARRMPEGGSIINIASLNARQPAQGLSAYCAAKAGVEMLTKVAAMELGARGIRVNAIAPGLVDTPLTTAFTQSEIKDEFLDNTPLGRIGAPEDIASAALFLAGDDSSWMTGDLMLVDGGGHTMRHPKLLGR